jgi:hypothetical protein
MVETDFYLLLRLLVFDILAAFVLAKLEINIEGKNGWASNLPTWKIQNKFTKLFWGEQPYTGYHFWILITTLTLFHLPFFIFPSLWSLSLETLILGNYLIGVLIEDVLWFALNPHYGLRKFNKTDAHWHDAWVGPVPLLYLKMLVPATILIALSFYL